MKCQLKGIVIVLLLFVTTIFVQAQKNNLFKSKFMIGVTGGPVFTTVDFVQKVPQNTTNGFSAGVSAKYISEKHLGILAELNYTQRGWTENFADTNTPEHAYSRTLSYVELPLMTHIYFGNKVKFILNIGPQVSYMIGDKATMNEALSDYIDWVLEEDPNYPIGIQYKSLNSKFDYGLIGGLGVEFDTSVGSFNLEGRYYFGLGDSFDSSRSSSSNFSRSAHRYFAGKLTYYFMSL